MRAREQRVVTALDVILAALLILALGPALAFIAVAIAVLTMRPDDIAAQKARHDAAIAELGRALTESFAPMLAVIAGALRR
ncbi:MAG: hypothetical protein JWM87_763 [Candidatus Eremiobacteraeota bacterium]|nr:hypothetical protein [Candidatus Eremiobacteraeota bacterium]